MKKPKWGWPAIAGLLVLLVIFLIVGIGCPTDPGPTVGTTDDTVEDDSAAKAKGKGKAKAKAKGETPGDGPDKDDAGHGVEEE